MGPHEGRDRLQLSHFGNELVRGTPRHWDPIEMREIPVLLDETARWFKSAGARVEGERSGNIVVVVLRPDQEMP